MSYYNYKAIVVGVVQELGYSKVYLEYLLVIMKLEKEGVNIMSSILILGLTLWILVCGIAILEYLEW